MSGQVVIIPAVQIFNPAIFIAGGALLGAGAATLGLAVGAKALVDAQVAAALRKAEKEKAQIAEWVNYQHGEQQRMQELTAVEEALQSAEQLLASLDLSVVRAGEEAEAESPEAQAVRSYLTFGKRKSPEEIAAAANELTSILHAFPEEFRTAAESPYSKFERQCAALRDKLAAGKKVQWDEIAAMKQTIIQSLRRFVEQVTVSHQFQLEMAERMESLLSDVLFYRNVAAANPFLETQRLALDSLRGQVTALLDSGEIRTGQVALIEKRLARLRAEIDARVVQTAHRTALCDSISRNLVDMGYQELETFDLYDESMASATMRIPGGERVRIAVHQNGQAAFEFQHERSEDAGAFSRDEWAFFRQQEKKWCKDAKELVRRLVAEGFEYQMTLEKEVSEQAIKVVVVETADELAAREEEARFQEEQKKRYLDR